MKLKSILLTAVATLGLTAATMAQSNCELITSATLTALNNNYQALGQDLGCVNANNPPNNAGTAVYEPVLPDQWSLITLTKASSNECKLYVNGNLIFNGSYANITYAWNSINIGAGFGSNYFAFYKGFIDEVRLSNIVRTSTEIQNSFSLNSPFSQDANTIGLWHFDQTNGTTINSIIGVTGSISNAVWSSGYFNNGLYFNGTNAYLNFPMSVPTSAFTFEAWVKPEGVQGGVLFQPYGFNSAGIQLFPYTETTNYVWSNGESGNSITIDPATLPYIWVTDGNCTDTIWFNSQSATIYDTTYVTVTDTLLINTSVTGVTPPNNLNTIRVFPNPASTHITIDYGNFAIMNGYQLVIENSIGQQVFQTNITQQSDYLSLATWGGNGLYFVHIIDPQGNTIDIRKIVLQ
jgi:hypothetical protein